MMKGLFWELLLIDAQVSVWIMAGAKVIGIKLLRSDQKPKFELKGSKAVTVPKILDHEIVILRLVYSKDLYAAGFDHSLGQTLGTR